MELAGRQLSSCASHLARRAPCTAGCCPCCLCMASSSLPLGLSSAQLSLLKDAQCTLSGINGNCTGTLKVRVAQDESRTAPLPPLVLCVPAARRTVRTPKHCCQTLEQTSMASKRCRGELSPQPLSLLVFV